MSVNTVFKDLYNNPLTTAGLVTGAQYVLSVAASNLNPFTTTLTLTAVVSAVADATVRVANNVFGDFKEWPHSKDAIKTLVNAGSSFGGAVAAQWLNNNFLVNYFPKLGSVDNHGRLVIAVAVFATNYARLVLQELASGCGTKKPASV